MGTENDACNGSAIGYNGEDFEKYYEGTGTTEKELMDEFIKEAEKQLKSRMVLYEIARDRIYWNIN